MSGPAQGGPRRTFFQQDSFLFEIGANAVAFGIILPPLGFGAGVYQSIDAGIAFALEPGGRAFREESEKRGARSQRGGIVACRETGKCERGVEVFGNRFADFLVPLPREGVPPPAI